MLEVIRGKKAVPQDCIKFRGCHQGTLIRIHKVECDSEVVDRLGTNAQNEVEQNHIFYAFRREERRLTIRLAPHFQRLH
jgi:hypothetical protein